MRHADLLDFPGDSLLVAGKAINIIVGHSEQVSDGSMTDV